MTPKITVELDFADREILRHFQSELARAAAGQIPVAWIERSFRALPSNIRALFLSPPDQGVTH